METMQMRARRAATVGAARGHQGVRNGRNDEKRTKSDPRDRIKSDHIKPNPTKSDQKKWTSPDQGAGRWIKTGTDEPRFGSSSVEARRFGTDEWESQRLERS